MLGNGVITYLREKDATNFPKISGMTEVGSKERRVAMANCSMKIILIIKAIF